MRLLMLNEQTLIGRKSSKISWSFCLFLVFMVNHKIFDFNDLQIKIKDLKIDKKYDDNYSFYWEIFWINFKWLFNFQC